MADLLSVHHALPRGAVHDISRKDDMIGFGTGLKELPNHRPRESSVETENRSIRASCSDFLLKLLTIYCFQRFSKDISGKDTLRAILRLTRMGQSSIKRALKVAILKNKPGSKSQRPGRPRVADSGS